MAWGLAKVSLFKILDHIEVSYLERNYKKRVSLKPFSLQEAIADIIKMNVM
jgi:hypothetical protein